MNKEGTVADVKLVESNAPKDMQKLATNSIRNARYRPRFVDGEPVDTQNVRYRQSLYVQKTK